MENHIIKQQQRADGHTRVSNIERWPRIEQRKRQESHPHFQKIRHRAVHVRSVRFPAAPPSNSARPAALTALASRPATSSHAINPMISTEPTMRITRVQMLEPFEKKLNAIPGFRERIMLNQLGITTCGKYVSGRDSIHAFVARSSSATISVSQSHRIRPGMIMSSRKRRIAYPDEATASASVPPASISAIASLHRSQTVG